MAQIVVNIAGRPYRMACEDGEEAHLANLAKQVDDKISEMRGAFGEIGDQRLIVMSAIAIADELHDLRQRLAKSILDVTQARRDLEEEGKKSDGWADQIADQLDRASDRIERVARTLKNAPSPD